MEIRNHETSKWTVLTIRDDVDLATSPVLRSHLENLLLSKKRPLALDLSGVTHMDSSGIAVLIEGFRWAKKVGVPFVLLSPSPQVRMILELGKLEEFFDIRNQLEDESLLGD
jgi:anti-anti-sigma factor